MGRPARHFVWATWPHSRLRQGGSAPGAGAPQIVYEGSGMATPSVRTFKRHAFRQLGLSLCAGSVASACAALWSAAATDASGGAGLLAVVLAPGLAIPFAFVSGILQIPLVIGWQRLLRRSGLQGYLRLFRHARLLRDRSCLRRYFAAKWQLGFVGCGTLLILWIAAPALERVQDAEFKRVLLLLLGASALAGLGAAAALSSPLFRRASSWLDERLTLPWPSSGRWRAALILVPLLLWLGRLLANDAELLGFALAPLLVLEWALLLKLFSVLPVPQLRWRGNWRSAALGIAVLWTLVTAPALKASPGAAKALSASALNGPLLSYLRLAVNADRDEVDSTAEPTTGAATRALFPSPVFSGAYPKEDQKPYNVLWIVADAMRPDHMSFYGYDRETTPHLDAQKKGFTYFDHAYVQATTTHLSIPSMLTGRSPLDMRWVGGKDKLRVSQSLKETTLAERLQARGYRTGAVVSGHIQRLGNMLQGFDEVLRTRTKQGAPHTNYLAQQFLSQQRAVAANSPFFLFVYYEDAHAPYTKRRLGLPEFGAKPQDAYDSEIALVDRHVGQLLQGLRYDKEWWKNTLIIITADHGEEFKEHGRRGHGSNCHRETMQVPLLARLPGVRGGPVTAPVALIDVVPTILEMLGQPDAPEELTGQSLLVPALSPAAATPRLIPCVTTKQGSSKSKPYFRRAIRTESHLFVDHATAKVRELFDLRKDVKERNDISGHQASKELEASLMNALDTPQGNLKKFRLK